MFLNELSHDQRRAFLVLARQIIDADDRLTLAEVEVLDRLYAETGMDAENADAPSAAGDLNFLYPTERTRAVVLVELLMVAFSDGILHPREEQAIFKIASRLQIDQGSWSSILEWAHRYAVLAEEARRFGRGGASFRHDD